MAKLVDARKKDALTTFSNLILYCGVVAEVARQAHNLEVVGSSPTPATNLRK